MQLVTTLKLSIWSINAKKLSIWCICLKWKKANSHTNAINAKKLSIWCICLLLPIAKNGQKAKEKKEQMQKWTRTNDPNDNEQSD